MTPLLRHFVPAALAAVLLAGCGGGGSTEFIGGGGTTPAPTPTPLPQEPFSVDCAGAFCGADNANRYTGSGVGAWRYRNVGSGPAEVQVRIDNVSGKTATLVYSNESTSDIALPAVTLNNATLQNGSREAGPPAREHRTPPQVEAFNAGGFARLLGQASSAPGVLASRTNEFTVGATRSWINQDDNGGTSQRATTLRRQLSATGGRQVNVWVETSEYGPDKVSDAIIDTLATTFASGNGAIYPLVTGVAGEPWGTVPAASAASLIGPDQAIDLVVVNQNANGRAYGVVAYFYSGNNFVRASNASSNEALAIFTDSETLYLDGSRGLTFAKSTLAHELTHMINFYQRAVQIGSGFAYATWLEEMTAIMMEDLVSTQVTPGYNSVRDDRFPAWLAGAEYNCPLTVWQTTTSCFGYDISGSFGAFLLRQHGVGFYKTLLRDKASTDSVAVLDDAIRQSGGAGMNVAFQRWGTGIALLPAAASPAGFGYPARSEAGFSLVAISGPDYVGKRRLPTALPATLYGYGHFPFVRLNLPVSFNERFVVPAHTTLSVIVQ
ncbi:hypothetical protein [Jeongeupia sp. USM3]|uniref:M30 family zinc metallopeptidase n=1 Tax=Jeongeupia sp. USM3 TaxID=1906741 RepID=UPI00089E0690|nr:hypothetical protein [Jeongeupia sp. USM3]AOY01138.1 hypothetical protein BJP62_12195 [Jeongeupia sp. USM3]